MTRSISQNRFIALLTGSTKILFIGFIILLFLEIIGRIFNPFGISYYPETARYLDTMIIEKPIGYRNRPHLKDNFYGVPVKINNMGYRNNKINIKKDNSEFRIMLLGDSLVFGIGVTQEDSMSSQLEDLLNKNASQKFQVLNMGTISYNTEQQLIQLKKYMRRSSPDIVALLFMANDFEPKMWVFDKRRNIFINFAQRSYAVSWITSTIKIAMFHVNKTDPYSINNINEKQKNQTRNHLKEIAEFCRNSNVPFILGIPFTSSSSMSAFLHSIGKKEGFDVIDIDPWDDPRWETHNRMAYRNSVVDPHPNREGHKLYAKIIYEKLKQLNYF